MFCQKYFIGGGVNFHHKSSCLFIFIFLNLFYLFIYFWLCWVFVAVRRLFSSCGKQTLRRGARASHCSGFSCCGTRALGMQASVVVAHRPSSSAACGIFPDQGSNPRSLHWQADSQPLRHQGSPPLYF